MKNFLFIFFLLFFSCNQTSMLEIDKEYLASENKGEIREIEKWKGGGHTLTIKNDKETSEIGVYKTVGEKSKKHDHFVKFKNSNKCLLKRNDSVICLDCIYIEKEIRDSIGKIDEWKSFEKNIWKKTTTASH